MTRGHGLSAANGIAGTWVPPTRRWHGAARRSRPGMSPWMTVVKNTTFTHEIVPFAKWHGPGTVLGCDSRLNQRGPV